MSGPWEKFQPRPTQSPTKGPWTRFKGEQADPNQERRQSFREKAQAAKEGRLEPSAETLAAVERANAAASPVPPEPDTAQIQSQIDQHQDSVGTAAALLNKAGEALTLGVVGDEAAGAFDELIGRGPKEERTQFYRDQEAKLEEEHPGLSLAAEIAPAMLPGAGAAGAVAKLGSLTGKAAAAGITGAAAGGLYGFMEGDDGNRVQNAAYSGLAGGLLGAAAPKLTDFGASVPSRVKRLFLRSAKRPSVKALDDARAAAYKAVDEAGETFDGASMVDLAAGVRRAFEENNYVEETDTALTATLKLLDKRAGKETTLTQLDNIRKNLWKRYAAAKDQPQILDAIGQIDDLINSRGDTSELMSIARAANARYAKSKLIQDAFTKAEDQTAGSGSGGNILNKYRQAVTSIINDERKAKFFTADEIDVMRSFVRGDRAENFMRLIGKMSPSGNGLMTVLHTYGGIVSNGATLPLMGVGAIAKSSADRSSRKGAEAIQDYLAGVAQESVEQSTGAALASGSAPVAERLQAGTQSMPFRRQSVPQ